MFFPSIPYLKYAPSDGKFSPSDLPSEGEYLRLGEPLL